MASLISLKKGKHSHPSGRRNALNDLTGSEWAQSSKSIMAYDDTRSDKQRAHGAAFPQSLAEHHIMVYTKRGETVLDPFAGVGTTLDACLALGRKGIGIELNPEFVELAKADIDRRKSGSSQRIICGDARNLLTYVQRDSVDFVLTSPPYADMLNSIQRQFLYKWKPFGMKASDAARPYSKDEADIGNLAYPQALAALRKVLTDTLSAVKADHYAAWVVRDFRDLKHGRPYVNFHNDVISEAEAVGWTLWDVRIFDQTRFRPLVILGIPSRNFYLNIGHSYILIFKKQASRLQAE